MKTFYEQTIIDSIDFSGYEDDSDIYGDYPLYTDIHNLFYIFMNEYGWRVNQLGNENEAFSEWLRGLPSVLTVPFWNSEILDNAKKAGFSFATEEQEDEFLDSYWIELSNAFFTLKNNL